MPRLATFILTALLLCSAAASAAQSASDQTRQVLDRALPASVVVDFRPGVSFRDALEFLHDISGVNFHVNWKAIAADDVDAETPVRFLLRKAPLRKALDMTLSEAAGGEPKLAFYIDDGVIEITSRAQADSILITRVYAIQDLLVEPVDSSAMGAGMGIMNPMMGMMGGGMGSGSGGRNGYSGGSSGRNGMNYSGGYNGGGGSGMYGPGMYPGGGSGAFPGMNNGWNNGGNSGWNTNTQMPGSRQTAQKSPTDELVDIIKSVIYPAYWTDGKASIKAYNGTLIIRAPRIIHEALAGPVD
jgi:hypothetical protein